jgi:hypothetical protein
MLMLQPCMCACACACATHCIAAQMVAKIGVSAEKFAMQARHSRLLHGHKVHGCCGLTTR